MKAFHINIKDQKVEEEFEKILLDFANKGTIEYFQVTSKPGPDKPSNVSEDQAEEIIDESEIGPYYSEKEAKEILKL